MKPTVRKIWDNVACKLDVPPEMGQPSEGQLAGSPWDNLVELAGRVCYDSLGRGRDSVAYHQHIREIGHRSVLEHATFTLLIPATIPAITFLNRPSLWVRRGETGDWRVTMNLRHAVEWKGMLAPVIRAVASQLAPLIVQQEAPPLYPYVEPETPEETWITFYLGNVSRGLTHELVRHGDWTAISQRSTRYCDESESPWAWHPLIQPKHDDEHHSDNISWETWDKLHDVKVAAKDAYRAVVEDMTSRGIERKQARGAARGVLGNALSTEIIFSASLAQWRWILSLRNHPTADAEIRNVAATIKEQLDAARYSC